MRGMLCSLALVAMVLPAWGQENVDQEKTQPSSCDVSRGYGIEDESQEVLDFEEPIDISNPLLGFATRRLGGVNEEKGAAETCFDATHSAPEEPYEKGDPTEWQRAPCAFPEFVREAAGVRDNYFWPMDPANLTDHIRHTVGILNFNRWVGFDARETGRHFGHQFLPVFQPVADSFLYGTLMLHLRPIAGNFQDDTISLWAEGAPSGWSARLSTLGVTMVAGQETELVLDLRTLSTGSASILKDITQYGNLNVYLQNDTAVDDMLLTLSCQNNASPPMLVGVVRGEQGCGNMKAYDVFLDNEDRRNANDRRPWIGATVSDKNTLLRLCGTDGQQFASAAQNGAIFALVALSNRCPDGFVRFDRFHDNEDRNPASWDSAPSGSPTATVGSKRDTNLAFCVAPGPNIPVGNGVFPDLGVPYGVFGGRNREGAVWALDRGWVFLDDEDNNNRNQPRNPPGYTWIFLEGGSNTRYFFARVK